MVDHHFTKLQLAALVGGLDRAGIPLIEVGHGKGVGSQFFNDPAIRSTSLPLVGDCGHAKVALRVAPHARVGVLLTIGQRFAPIEYIDRIAELGFAFIRLAVMPDELDDRVLAYVRRVKDRKLLCSINVMQTYVKTPAQIAAAAARAADNGLDWWYIVDSAGGMMADDVKAYVTAVLEAANVQVGIHSHNNLGCAVGNALAAVEAGATLVDGSLNGIGRATGNPATEQLAVALRDRLTHDIDLDVLAVLGSAVRSLFRDKGNDPFDFLSGGALVHSRNVPAVLDAARRRQRSRGSYLLAVGAEARKRRVLNAFKYSDELYDSVLTAATPERRFEPNDAMVDVATEHILDLWNGGPTRAVEELSVVSRQRDVPSVVHVSKAAAALCAGPVPWQSAVVGLTIPWSDRTWDIAADRAPDYVLVDDGDPDPPIAGTIATWRFAFAEVRRRAVEDLCSALRQLGQQPVVLDDGGRDHEVPTGAVAVLSGGCARERVQALRRRQVRVVTPDWPAAVAQIAQSLIALHGQLSAPPSDGAPVAGVDVCGPGQWKWDRERAVLLDAEEPSVAARGVGVAYLAAFVRGERRL